GIGLNLPVIYAGNRDAYSAVEELLENRASLRHVPNLRPTMERENLLPAREAIHELFLEHVMQQAPGYSKLASWTSTGIMSARERAGGRRGKRRRAGRVRRQADGADAGEDDGAGYDRRQRRSAIACSPTGAGRTDDDGCLPAGGRDAPDRRFDLHDAAARNPL